MGLSFPPPGDLPNTGIKPAFLASHALTGGFFTIAPPGKPQSANKDCHYGIEEKEIHSISIEREIYILTTYILIFYHKHVLIL